MATAEYLSTRRVGDADVTLILEGAGPFPVDLNVPEATWRSAVPEAAPDGTITLSTGGAFVRLADAAIVIDPGLDDPGTPAMEQVERVFVNWSMTPGFQAALAELGVSNDAVTHVIITHAHFDHFLGVAVERDGTLVPRFPNARHLLDRADWDLHFTPDGEQRPLAASPFVEVNRTARERLQLIMRAGLLDLVTGEHEVVPGVTTVPAPGESPGHRAVRVASNGAVWWHLGDLAHYAVEFEHPDWLTPTRRDADAMLSSRQRILPRAVADDGLVSWSHAPFPGWGRVVAVDAGYRWVPSGS